MVDINADIISFKSMGNVCLGQSIDFYLDDIFSRYDVDIKQYSLPFPSEEKRHGYTLDHGALIISTTPDDIIVSVGGNEDYCGKYNGMLYPGMTMEALIRHAKDLRIVNGSLIVDGDYGLSFSLPAPYDEIADVIQQIPLDLPLNEIYVCDHSAWAPKQKKKRS